VGKCEFLWASSVDLFQTGKSALLGIVLEKEQELYNWKEMKNVYI
jgi:hypothetical protein